MKVTIEVSAEELDDLTSVVISLPKPFVMKKWEKTK
jgi:hypothetical protein